MSEPVRSLLRLLGVVLLLAGLGIVAVMIYPGPRDIADWMGNSCANSRGGPGEQCSIWDVLSFLWAAPVLILVGFVMALALRPEGKGPVTIDLSGRRRP